MTTSPQPFDPSPPNEVVTCTVIRTHDFDLPHQSHQEFEIMLIVSGTVQRRIGNHKCLAQAGDLVLIGPHLPHGYRNAIREEHPPSEVQAISITFKPGLLGPWLQFADALPLQDLFRASAQGLQVHGATRQKIAASLPRLAQAQGIPRLILLIELLYELSLHPQDLTTITSATFSPALASPVQHRLHRIARFIQKRLSDPLYLEDVARHLGMSSVSLSRYLRCHLQKTFPTYLNELRIARVCRLLRDTDATVSEISLHCGFDSMANFERQFRKLQGCSPKVYRHRATLQPATPFLASSPHHDKPISWPSEQAHAA